MLSGSHKLVGDEYTSAAERAQPGGVMAAI